TGARPATTLSQRFQEIERSADIDARVRHRVGDAFADVDLRREMNDDIEGCFRNQSRGFGRANVELVKARTRVEILSATGREVIEDMYVVVAREKYLRDVRTNETSAPGD